MGMSAEFVCGTTVLQTPGAASQSNCFNKEMYRLNFMRKSVVRFRQMTYIDKCWKTPVLSGFFWRGRGGGCRLTSKNKMFYNTWRV